MAGMTCTCGAELSNHEVPNDIQLRVYTDREWDEIFDCNIVHHFTSFYRKKCRMRHFGV